MRIRATFSVNPRVGTAIRTSWAARLFAVLAALACAGAPNGAQGQTTAPVEIDGVTMSGSVRTRVESWDWFGDDPSGQYTYSGSIARIALGQLKPRVDWQIELAVPFILGLPDQAVAPGARGAQGLGANYFAANDRSTNTASLFAKQAFARFKRFGGVEGQSLKVGRIEFIDGTEVSPKNVTLAALKRDRIAHRLLGNFAFSHVGRSFDGVLYAIDRPTWNVTVLGARATQGVFQVNGWGELNVNVEYGAVTGQLGSTTTAGEWRLFGLGYQDMRHDTVKVDNRPLAVRQADTGGINIATFGGHYLRATETAGGQVDVLLWGAVQVGTWGQLAQRAGAWSAEVGWQPKGAAALAPWLRGGFDYGSGDGDPNDQTHGTFFQVLPTPRVYARVPFFNMMNTEDAFGELLIRPSKTVTGRADIHSLRLTSASDLWYQGGGAFQPSTFGYAGRSSNGHKSLATLYDASAEVTIDAHVAVTVYYGCAARRDVTKAIYPGASGGRFGYGELMVRF